PLHLQVTMTPHLDADHQIESLFMAWIELTTNQQAEDEIRTMMDTIPQLVWMMRPDGSCEYANQRLLHYAGMTIEQIQGNGWLHYVYPDDLKRVLAVWRRSVRTGSPYEIVHRLRNGATGAYRWFLVRGLPLRDSQGEIHKWFGTCTDIDE